MGVYFSESVAVEYCACNGRTQLGNSGFFQLLTQPTEVTTSLFIFDKQWHTCL